jgi:hypothetical protein
MADCKDKKMESWIGLYQILLFASMIISFHDHCTRALLKIAYFDMIVSDSCILLMGNLSFMTEVSEANGRVCGWSTVKYKFWNLAFLHNIDPS